MVNKTPTTWGDVSDVRKVSGGESNLRVHLGCSELKVKNVFPRGKIVRFSAVVKYPSSQKCECAILSKKRERHTTKIRLVILDERTAWRRELELEVRNYQRWQGEQCKCNESCKHDVIANVGEDVVG